jgi:sulfonate transport system substrate-binding protein
MNTHTLRSLRRLAAPAALLAVAGLGLAGCGGASSANTDAIRSNGSVDLSKVTLVVGDQKGGSQSLLEAAGLANTPYQIEWKTFTSGPPLLEALNSGAIDVGAVGNTPPIFAAAAHSKFKAVEASTAGGAGDAIVVPKDSPITSVSQLKGKQVAVAEGSSANYDLLAQLKNAGLSYSDVQVQNLQPADALAAFTAGHIDAWAIWDPYTSQAVQQAGARVLVNGTNVVNGYGFQVASDAALGDKATKAALADYLGRIAQAQTWSATHGDQWAQTWAQATGLPPAVTEAAVKDRTTKVLPIDGQVIASEQDMANAFTQNKLLPGSVDLSAYFDDEFNDAVEKAATTGAGS